MSWLLFKILDRTSPHFHPFFVALLQHFLPFFAAPYRTFRYSGEVQYCTFWHFLPHLNIAPAGCTHLYQKFKDHD